jgi:flagellar export protein FliJ
MKRFAFRLERVLSFRRNQRRQSERHLRQMQLRQALLQEEDEAIGKSEERTRADRFGATQATGLDLNMSEAYLQALGSRRGSLCTQQQENSAAVEQARASLIERDRQVKLLERLRERGLREYRRLEEREQQTEAGEGSLNLWKKRNR